ncbi:S41 family peptidase [Taibaiella koreensis]|uniref:S41 family peptidase n=1 Tax=Taibaiella koreensis TaxID=1268548 RepID=UPI000E59B2C6|nr:S41 family peptidase [Taibaiella koreensis]
MKKELFLLVQLLLVLYTGSRAQAVPDNTEGRLWRLCKVSGYLRYYSPNTCRINWDSLLQQTIPLVKNATSNAAFNDHMDQFLQYAGQIPATLATLPPVVDSNMNLQLAWTDDPAFSVAVRDFLDTFKCRAGYNDSLECRLIRNQYRDPAYRSYVDFSKDKLSCVTSDSLEADRLLQLFYYWNAFNYLGPYRNLADQSWDSVLLQAISEVMAAPTTTAFVKALAGMQSRLDDSHGFFKSEALRLFPGSFTGLRLRWVENKIIVDRVMPDIPGVSTGDELLAIDGVPVATIVNSYHDLYPSSNEPAFYREACSLLVRGPGKGRRSFMFRNASAHTYTRDINDTLDGAQWSRWLTQTDRMPVWTTLCNGYGYVNMGKLMPEQVDSMYAALKDKPAIVFDVRNYPNGTMAELARYLFSAPVTTALIFRPNLKAPGWFSRDNDNTNLGTWSNPHPYKGRLYFMVNEMTQSHAEYTVQYLSHAPGAIVVGSQTAGADGNINIINHQDKTFWFTGLGWYYDDGYQCQRNGLKIDQVVRPTIASMRAGRDEVLESITGCPIVDNKNK